jgi:hypothetical protein
LVIDYQWKEGTFCHPQKPSDGEKATEVENSDYQNGTGAKGKHHTG